MSYRGDINLGDTIDLKFTTVNASGVPTQLAGSPAVAAYPDNSITELTAGITLTVDFDTRTGLNNVRVVASSGNGYATATNYDLVITAGTVSGNSVVGYVVGSFSIEKRSALRPTTAGRTLAVEADGHGHADLKEWLGVAPLGLNAQRVQTLVNALAAGSITATEAPNLDAAISTRATPAQVNAEVDAALDTAIPTTPTADSVNERLKRLEEDVTPTRAGNLDNLDAAVTSRLAPTTAGRTLDVAVGGEAGMDLDNTVGTLSAAEVPNLDAAVSSRATPAQVNAEVLDVLGTDTQTLPGQAAPPLTPTLIQAITWLYKLMRNRKTQDATDFKVYADDETTVDHKAAVTTSAGVTSVAEIQSGP